MYQYGMTQDEQQVLRAAQRAQAAQRRQRRQRKSRAQGRTRDTEIQINVGDHGSGAGGTGGSLERGEDSQTVFGETSTESDDVPEVTFDAGSQVPAEVPAMIAGDGLSQMVAVLMQQQQAMQAQIQADRESHTRLMQEQVQSAQAREDRLLALLQGGRELLGRSAGIRKRTCSKHVVACSCQARQFSQNCIQKDNIRISKRRQPGEIQSWREQRSEARISRGKRMKL